MENATRKTLTNAAGQDVHALNDTASQFAVHSTTLEATRLIWLNFQMNLQSTSPVTQMNSIVVTVGIMNLFFRQIHRLF
jgi:hypothetical protein